MTAPDWLAEARARRAALSEWATLLTAGGRRALEAHRMWQAQSDEARWAAYEGEERAMACVEAADRLAALLEALPNHPPNGGCDPAYCARCMRYAALAAYKEARK